jgi:hypothetical protein
MAAARNICLSSSSMTLIPSFSRRYCSAYSFCRMLHRLAVLHKIISENQALDQGRFLSECHLQTHTIRHFNDGLDCRLHDSAARQFHLHIKWVPLPKPRRSV